jgi:hypothetical protein
MNDDYYVDVVTKNILSALSEHISDAISDQLIGVVKKTTSQLESKIFTMFDSVSKDIANSIHDNMIGFKEKLQAIDSINDAIAAFKDRLRAIDSIEAGINEIRQKLGAVNTEQIDALARTVEAGLASIVSEMKASLGENNKAQLDSLKAAIDDSGGKIDRLDAAVVNSMASVEGKIDILKEAAAALLENSAKDIGAATEEDMKAAIRAEFKTMEGYLSAARIDQSEILRMMLEGELRSAEAMADRVQNNKKEIEERLKRLNGFIEGAPEGR